MRARPFIVASSAVMLIVSAFVISTTIAPRPVVAQGVGSASWTPTSSSTIAIESEFLIPSDSITFETTAEWTASQASGLERYVGDGLRYTHEVNDRSGRLSATGYWATNHPDPAFDRDDDDGDGRWEEAEITVGVEAPRAGRTYKTLIQFTRWHGKQKRSRCDWAWDRRLGTTEVLSQLSRDLLGEWQAERYTLDYDQVSYPRVGLRPALPLAALDAECSVRGPLEPSHAGVVVTLTAPLDWSEFLGLPSDGAGRWTAFEAIGTSGRDGQTWTCGGPVDASLALRPCRSMGVKPDGVVAAVGYFDEAAAEALKAHPAVAQVDGLRDAITDILSDIGGFGVQPPDLTVNDAYWELFLAS